jgi:hypothetical protein
MGLIPIVTDASYFISVLKRELVKRGEMRPDGQFEDVAAEYGRVQRAHHEMLAKLPLKKNPDILYALCFQDGLMHGLERIIVRRATGEYSEIGRIRQLEEIYKEIQAGKVRGKIFHDVAYIEGYREAFLFLLATQAERKTMISHYYVPRMKYPVRTLEQFRRARRESSITKAELAYAKRIVDRLAPGTTFHHLPSL